MAASILPGPEAKGSADVSNRHIGESGSFKARSEGHRIDYDHGIEEMHELKPSAPDAVGADEYTAGFQHPEHLANQPVLKRSGRNVMQDRERHGAGEYSPLERHRRRITVQDADIRPLQAAPVRACDRSRST
jgi:hypothetical protein